MIYLECNLAETSIAYGLRARMEWHLDHRNCANENHFRNDIKSIKWLELLASSCDEFFYSVSFDLGFAISLVSIYTQSASCPSLFLYFSLSRIFFFVYRSFPFVIENCGYIFGFCHIILCMCVCAERQTHKPYNKKQVHEVSVTSVPYKFPFKPI